MDVRIEARGLTKRYGSTVAVDDLTFTVEPGRVTGFLGPNGAGKTTTMRMVLGLDLPTSGTVTVGGHRYADLPAPLRTVGALLDARALHPAGPATTTCSRSRRATASPADASTRCSRRWACRPWPAGGPGRTRWA